MEHLTLDKALIYLTKSFEILKKDGLLFISTPNIDHINQLWKQDITHIQQYPAKDLYSILRMIGFSPNIEIHRIYLTEPKIKIKRKIIEFVRRMFNYILGTDYAQGILIIAQK